MRIGDKVRINAAFHLRKFRGQTGTIEDIAIYKDGSDGYTAKIKIKFDSPIESSFDRDIHWIWMDAQFVEDIV